MLEIRPAQTDEDLERFLAVTARVTPEDRITVAEVRLIEQRIETVHLLAAESGEPVGAARVGRNPYAPKRTAAFANVTVLSEHRRRGTGSKLYRAVSDWARARQFDSLEGHLCDDDPDSLMWAQHREFVETTRELRVELDVTSTEPPRANPPAGIEIVAWAERPELARAMYAVACEAYNDIPGNEDDVMEPYEDWLAHDMGGPGDKPEATFIALDGDAVVGYAKFSLTEAQPTVAYHDLTAVKRAWRGRGIAGALKRAEIAWAKGAGYERLSTTNEERNEPIRRLNERLGYRPAPGRIFLRGPLSPA